MYNDTGNPVLDGIKSPVAALILLGMGIIFLMKDIELGAKFFAAAPSFVSKRIDTFWDPDQLWWVIAAISSYQILWWSGWLNWNLQADTPAEKGARATLYIVIAMNILSSVALSVNGYTEGPNVPYILEDFGANTWFAFSQPFINGNIWPLVGWAGNTALGLVYSLLPELLIGSAVQLILGPRKLS